MLYAINCFIVRDLNKLFLRQCIVNLVLLLAYSTSSYIEWGKLLGFPLVAVVNWTPLGTQIWFGGTVPVIIDGHFWVIHWSFVVMLVTIIVNLAVVWKILDMNSLKKAL